VGGDGLRYGWSVCEVWVDRWVEVWVDRWVEVWVDRWAEGEGKGGCMGLALS
jgi:hypothetical protein